MSIRARLLIGVLVLSAAALAAVDLVSHAALRSYLSDRLDQQLESSQDSVSRALLAKADRTGRARGLGLPPRGKLAKLPEADRPVPTGPSLPAGTYGEIRNSKGKTVLRTRFSYGEPAADTVELPGVIKASALGKTPTVVSAPSSTSSHGFRVAAFSLPRGRGTIIVAIPERELDQTLARLAKIELIVTAAALAAIALLTLWVIKVGLFPLEKMQRTARRIVAADLSRRVEPANERLEVGRLGIAINEMLSRIEGSFAEQEATQARLRQFVADASHELRTPLSSIRGYSELIRLGMTEDPRERTKAIGRIEDESKRMAELINNLLTLARLDETRPERREAVDLAKMLVEACDDARAMDRGRAITCDVGPRAVVDGDDSQLRQVLANLLGNAIRHTPAGTPVEASIRHREKTVVLSVRDHGGGLASGSEELVFERFWRESSARERGGPDDGGSGLGLAIVASIVAAYGGSCSASSPADGGALFEVALPAVDEGIPATDSTRDGNSQAALSPHSA